MVWKLAGPRVGKRSDHLINVILARAMVSYIAGRLQIGGRVVERLPDSCQTFAQNYFLCPHGSHAESNRGQLINPRVNGNRCRQN
jgi:hypothetical protein